MISTLHNILLGIVPFIGQRPKPANGKDFKPRSLRELLPEEEDIKHKFIIAVYRLENADSWEKIENVRAEFAGYASLMSGNRMAGPEIEYLEMARRRIEKLAEERGAYLKSDAYLSMVRK